MRILIIGLLDNREDSLEYLTPRDILYISLLDASHNHYYLLGGYLAKIKAIEKCQLSRLDQLQAHVGVGIQSRNFGTGTTIQHDIYGVTTICTLGKSRMIIKMLTHRL